MTPPIAASFASFCLDTLVTATVLGGMAIGARVGLFRSIVGTLSAIACLVFPLGVTAWLAQPLASLDVPAHLAIGGGFLVLITAALALIRRCAGALITDKSVRLPPLAERVGGGLLGACAGTIVAGTTLVAWSMLPMPRSLRLAPDNMNLDAGAAVLRAFGRCLSNGLQTRELLLEGEPLALNRPAHTRRPRRPPDAADAEPQPQIIRASEPFVDANDNGLPDAGDRYLDVDANGVFSPRLPFYDANENGRRDIGLRERYRLGCWDRVVVRAAPDDGPEPEPTGADAP